MKNLLATMVLVLALSGTSLAGDIPGNAVPPPPESSQATSASTETESSEILTPTLLTELMIQLIARI